MSSPISNSSTLREKRRQGLSPPEESSRRFSSGAVGETGSGRIAPSTAMAGKTTLSMRRTEAHRDAGDLRIHAAGRLRKAVRNRPTADYGVDKFACDWSRLFAPQSASLWNKS